MREIIFRGKRLDNGEWVYGWPFADTADCSLKKIGKCGCPHDGSEYFIVEWVDDYHEYEERQVIPNTVGQYTGLKDKNGKRIFEGDILKWDSREWGCDHLDIVNWNYELFNIRRTDWKEWCEVIGNIHDNKSLLNNQEVGE